MRSSFSRLPPYFIENIGQYPSDARFVARRSGGVVAFTDRGLSFAATKLVKDGMRRWALAAFDFGNTGEPTGRTAPIGRAPLPSNSNYFRGSDASKWYAGARHFEELLYEDIAPGVDLVVLVRDGDLAYDLHLDEGANVAEVEFVAHGCEDSVLEPDGTLRFESEAGTIRHAAPRAWYELPDGTTEPVVCRFERRGRDRFGFGIDAPRLAARLVIDPGLIWSTYFGGDVDEEIRAIDFQSGLVTVAGSTSSDATTFPVFPTTAPPNVQADLAGGPNSPEDAFVARLDPSQQGAAQLVWATYLGGTAVDVAHAVVVQANGNFAVVGKTTATGSAPSDFPVTTSTAIQATHPRAASGIASFVTYVTVAAGPTLNLAYSTFYGHPGMDTWANAVDLNDGRIITFGGRIETSWGGSGTIPFQAPTDPVQPWDLSLDNLQWEGYFARIDRGNPASTPPIPAKVVYATYLSHTTASGGPGTWPPGAGIGAYEEVTSVKYRGGFVYLGGYADSWDMNFGSNAFKRTTDKNFLNWNGYVMQFDTASTLESQQLVYGTFIGGDTPISDGMGNSSRANDHLYDIDVFQGAIYACGWTNAADFPVTTYSSTNVEAPGYWHLPPQWIKDTAFVVKLIPEFNPPNFLQDLRYGTYLGGSEVDWAHSIARISSQAVVVAGYTTSDGSAGFAFPTAGAGSAPYDSTHDGGEDGFLTYLNWSTPPSPSGHPILSQLRYSTFHGSSDNDKCFAVAADGLTAYVGGSTYSTAFPTTPSAFDVSLGGNKDGFASSFGLPASYP